MKSLKPFDKYRYFIECDIEAPTQLYDKFNDFPFFPVQKADMYSDGIKRYVERRTTLWTK